MANKGVTIRNTVVNCTVKEGIENTGKIEVHTDGKTNFFIGDQVTNTKAKSITHKPKIGQAIATPTNAKSVQGESGNTAAKVIIGNRIEKCEVKGKVRNESEISFQSDDKNEIILGDYLDKSKAKKIELDPTIKQRPITTQSKCNGDEVDGDNSRPRCVVCKIDPVNTSLGPCGHAQFCGKCIDRIDTIDKKCPICRRPFTNRQRIFLCPSTINESETTMVQGDVPSSITIERQQEAECRPSIGTSIVNPQPGQSVIFKGSGPAVVTKKARMVNNSVTYCGNGKEAMGLKNDIKTQASDKNAVILDNIGPMNQIKECQGIKNTWNVKIIPE